MEGEISNLYIEIDKHRCLPPPLSQEHMAMIMSILIQYGRTKYFADAMDEMHDKSFKHTFKEKIESELSGVDLDAYVVGIKDVAQYSLGVVTQYYPLLFDLGYKLLTNKTGVEFVTSDNPVVLYNQLMSFRTLGSNAGFSSKGLQIFFPISPDKQIFLYDDGVYRVGSDNKSVIELTDERDIYNLNALQACSCYENIYFMSEPLDAFALHRKVKPYLRKSKSNIKVFPEYDDGNRKSEIMMNYREDIRFNFDLSFLTLRNGAKEWRAKFRKLKRQPAAILRNQPFHDYAVEFVKKVGNKEYHAYEFIKFMKEKSSQPA